MHVLSRQMVGHVEQHGRTLARPTIRGHWDGELVADMPDGRAWAIFAMHPPPSRPNRQPALAACTCMLPAWLALHRTYWLC